MIGIKVNRDGLSCLLGRKVFFELSNWKLNIFVYLLNYAQSIISLNSYIFILLYHLYSYCYIIYIHTIIIIQFRLLLPDFNMHSLCLLVYYLNSIIKILILINLGLISNKH